MWRFLSSEESSPQSNKKKLCRSENVDSLDENNYIMSTLIGVIEPYGREDSIRDWLELFDNFCALNKVGTDKQMQYLLAYCGKFLYPKIKTICNPQKPLDCKYSETKDQLIAMLTPEKNVGLAWGQFQGRGQNEGETVQEFALAIKELAEPCDFGESLDMMLRMQFVNHLSNGKVRAKIRGKMPSSFEKAVTEASLIEQACNEQQAERISSVEARFAGRLGEKSGGKMRSWPKVSQKKMADTLGTRL